MARPQTKTTLDETDRWRPPKWLLDRSAEDLRESPLPLDSILESSLYYPASGLDADPIKYLSNCVASFVYADYGVDEGEFLDKLQNPGFRGYQPIVQRRLHQHELGVPDASDDLELIARLSDRYSTVPLPFFAYWIVFQRCATLGSDHGASRFSLLYICSEGLDVYRSLYLRRRIAPKVLAVIQTDGFGSGNHTEFEPKSGALCAMVASGEHRPAILLHGQPVPPKEYESPRWPGYGHCIGYLKKESRGQWGTIAAWGRSKKQAVLSDLLSSHKMSARTNSLDRIPVDT